MYREDGGDIEERVYCEDCHYRWCGRFGTRVGYCSHSETYNTSNFDIRETKKERYRLCTYVNERGLCKRFRQKESFFKRLFKSKYGERSPPL